MARQLAMATQSQLGKNLIAAIQRGGTEEAIPFCSIKAIPLTDSMAVAAKAKIQRVTDRPRNPLNSASEEEILAHIRKISVYELLFVGFVVPAFVLWLMVFKPF